MDILRVLSHYVHVDHALAIIGSAFFLGVVFLFQRSIGLNREIVNLSKDLRGILASTSLVDHETYERLSERMKRSKSFAHAWNEFDETVIRDDSESQIQIYNTKSFHDFVPTERFLEHSLNLSFYRKIPGIITSLGLFFTFLFIVFGLMELHPQATGKIEGVDKLITGLSAKFQSSVLAILCSLLFTVLEDNVIRRTERRFSLLIELLDAKFQRKTGEDYLRSVDKNMRELNHSMRRFSTDLAGVIKEGLQEGMRPSTDRLLVAIENLEKQKSENIADTLTKLLGDFKSSLNQSTGSEFAALGNSITKLAAIMDESAERSSTTTVKLDGLIRALDSQVEKQEQNSDASFAKVQQGFTHLLTSIEKNTQLQNENLNKLK